MFMHAVNDYNDSDTRERERESSSFRTGDYTLLRETALSRLITLRHGVIVSEL